jgi:hypothetical protein
MKTRSLAIGCAFAYSLISNLYAQDVVSNNQTHASGETPTVKNDKRQELIEGYNNEWRTPISFYGIVEDESNNVVSDAKVDFDCNDMSPEGTSFYHTKSDFNGSFSITGITGKLLGVHVNKEGYYPYHPSGDSFEYGDKYSRFTPDANNPVIFRLRKKGKGANLIHYDREFRLPRDGSPVLIDLAAGSTTSSGEDTMQVEGWTHDNDKKQGWKYDWECRVSVPNGGLQFYDEQFPFLAPESNYLSEDTVDMPVTNGAPWSDTVHRNYFIRTAGGNYGRMVFTMVAGGDNFCEVNLYFNPTGSRNLEPAQ